MENAIQKFQRNSESLPSVPTANDVARVRLDDNYPKYREVPLGERLFWLSKTVASVHTLAKVDISGRDSTRYAAALDSMMMDNQYMADLTQPEIVDAFRSGLFGAYGEYYGLSAISMYKFLDGYINSEKKREAAGIVRKTREGMLKERRERERAQEQARIRAEMEEAKRNGTFVPTGRAWFRPMKAETDSEEHRERVRLQAEKIMSGNI